MLSALPGGPLNKDKLCRARDKSSEMGHEAEAAPKKKKEKKTEDWNLMCTQRRNEPSRRGDYV